ncbi:MAG: heat shock 90 [Trebouxia sp. A1-2]|nr:MAG: heat shock 90 [Trebouxia sp. A1-2]
MPLADETISAGHGKETDAGIADREGVEHAFRGNSEKFEFQAEVNRLMDILINSLYSNKDVFLRELISNSADALDKIRFLSLTDKSQLGMGNDADLDIRMSIDKEQRTLTIRDKGVGMTKADLKNNLGTIAKSGTSGNLCVFAAFLEQMQKGGDVNLIGQFGVGFYSVYLVADYVEVTSKHNDDKQYVWESNASGGYAISEDTEGEQLGRGTQIKLFLKEETQEYLEEAKLKELEEEEEAAPKTVKETRWGWELLNDNKALWLRSANDVDEEEYDKFFQAISKTTDKPLAYSHFKAEGDVEFKSILFIPGKAPYDFMNNYYQNKPSLKLYVRRVFISDDFEELIPKYLSFVQGIVDSDTLPLQVSRENLQQHAALKTIKKKLVRKALDMIRKLADAETDFEAEDADKSDTEAAEEAKKYSTFWKEFGKAIKLGIIEDVQNRQRLAKLMRFETSKSGSKEIGETKEELENSPFSEQLLEKGYEIIYFTDPVDEYVMQNLMEYDDFKFQSASKEDLKLGDKDAKKENKRLKEEFKGVVTWWKAALADPEVENVKISTRLASTPCVVVTSKYGWSANMERIMRAQALGDAERQSYMKGKRILEINPRHPLIQQVKDKFEADPENGPNALAKILYETALLESGFPVKSPKAFNSRIYTLIKDAMDLKGDLTVSPQDDSIEEDDEVEDLDAADQDADVSDESLDREEL